VPKPSFDFIEIPLVREQLRAASRFVGDWEAEDFSGEIDSRMEQGGSEVRDLPLEFDSPIGVELDGHTFHEKTLEQVTYRNQRDRALQQIGWRVYHFSFAEFTKNPRESILEVVEHARFIYGRVIGYKAAAMGKYLPLAK
jgi:hypothetical protein